ncbi:MAG: glycosyltransferase family 1 protein [Dehalococcoidia bacterium]|nr:glycosyltransferase family 1 protein [Dehalococcoidia bacterium]
MRIGIDASRASTAQRTGTENYSFEIIQAIHSLQSSRADESLLETSSGADDVVLYFNGRPAEEIVELFEGYEIRDIGFPRMWTHIRLSMEMIVRPPDVLFVPAHVIPLVHPKRSVVTIHDMGHLYYPETYPKNTLRYLEWATRHNILSASAIIADSESTKKDIAKYFPDAEAKTTVVYPGVSPEFRPVTDENAIERVRENYGIPGEYFLYVGTIHPRKNIERLLQAYSRFVSGADGPRPRLVLVGKKGWLPEGIMRQLDEINAEVTLAGFVPQKDLPALYSGALALLLPSLFEGFGLPVVEAMACGTPVMTANTSSLPEIVCDAGLLTDPTDVQEMAEAMRWLWEKPALRGELRERGLKRAADFTWKQAAEKTLAVLEGQDSQ